MILVQVLVSPEFFPTVCSHSKFKSKILTCVFACVHQRIMSSYILYRQSPVATVKQHDMTRETISQIFQVGRFCSCYYSFNQSVAIYDNK